MRALCLPCVARDVQPTDGDLQEEDEPHHHKGNRQSRYKIARLSSGLEFEA